MTSVGVEPTFFHHSGCSQLDLLITSCSDKLLRFNQIGFPGLSQHDLIFASLDFDANPVTRVHEYRDYVNIDIQALRNAILSVNWDSFYNIQDSSEQVSFFNSSIKQIHDDYIPLRTTKSRISSNVWFSCEIRKAMVERDLA
ncbi:uncharacterized protein LOC131679601 [Topomyia yanbarensis]|uniref:uncharacterized protein LOC131679601 n=1 Tax=Topomyia yanbarensis TaxID=2498891 RepID=UPI00273BDC13|nr:uncharacterized protein LOC131679601 [Topomyia yanbarensis]